jgi:hypothetical protein
MRHHSAIAAAGTLMPSPPLNKFAVRNIEEDPVALIGDAELDIVDVTDEGRVIAECDQEAMVAASLDDFPPSLVVRVHSSDGFGTFLFHEVEIYSANDTEVMCEYICHQPNKYWEGTWGLATFLDAIRNQLQFFPISRSAISNLRTIGSG